MGVKYRTKNLGEYKPVEEPVFAAVVHKDQEDTAIQKSKDTPPVVERTKGVSTQRSNSSWRWRS